MLAVVAIGAPESEARLIAGMGLWLPVIKAGFCLVFGRRRRAAAREAREDVAE